MNQTDPEAPTVAGTRSWLTRSPLTEEARLRRSSGAASDGTGKEPADFAESCRWPSRQRPRTSVGIESILAGRSGSWEAEHVRNLLTSTVGCDEEYL